jgi:hypothetical protein
MNLILWTQAFSRTPEPSDWIRFESYARRVRTFTYEDVLSSAISSAKCDPIHDRVWDDIARTRTTLHILPNLRELCWLSNPHGLRGRSQLAHCLMLLPPGLSHLSARVSNIDDMDATSGGGFRPFAQNVLGRVPTLSTLDIHSSIPVSSIEPEFLALLAGLPALREVILPGYWLTSRVTEALSQLPKLHVVQYELFQPDRLGDPDDVASFDPQLKEGAFPALEDLSLAATVPDISRFFQSPYAPVELTHLFIHSPLIVPTAESVSSLLVHLGRNLPRLRELYLELRVGEAALRHGDKLPISALMPLSGFAALRVFEIYCMAPLQLTILELDTFAAALPPLEKLQLNPEPFLGTNGLSGGSLPIGALFIFARRCPQLLELGLFVTVFGAGIPGNDEFISDSGASLPPPLRKMRVLNFGSSPILFAPQASGTVAKWLSQICSSVCQITSGFTWDPVSLGYPESPNSQASCAAWEEAGRLLPLVGFTVQPMEYVLHAHESTPSSRRCEKRNGRNGKRKRRRLTIFERGTGSSWRRVACGWEGCWPEYL